MEKLGPGKEFAIEDENEDHKLHMNDLIQELVIEQKKAGFNFHLMISYCSYCTGSYIQRCV